MKQMQFFVEIHASKQHVWDTLWQAETFRQWAGIIDPGTYMKGVLKEGNEVEYVSAENGYGVTSLVERLVEGEYLLLRHSADTQAGGTRERKNEWTGGKESYSLAEKDSTTMLTAVLDVPLELEEYFTVIYPKAFAQVKALAENVK